MSCTQGIAGATDVKKRGMQSRVTSLITTTGEGVSPSAKIVGANSKPRKLVCHTTGNYSKSGKGGADGTKPIGNGSKKLCSKGNSGLPHKTDTRGSCRGFFQLPITG